MNNSAADVIVSAMLGSATREHGMVVGLLFYVGFFLLFCSLGTFGSAGLISYNASVAQSQWKETAAQIQDCSLREYGRVGDEFYALSCGIDYQLAGRSYRNSFLTNFTRSLHERSEISHWVSLNRPGTTLMVRVNPTYPREFIVESQLPAKRGRIAEDYTAAAIVMGSVGLILTTTGRALARRGW